MKLFDYKFLILFGLSFVVYFIYKEIEYLRHRISNIEISILSEQVPSFNNKILQNKEIPKVISIDLTHNTEIVSESETSVSSKHVAIYSNDNQDHKEEVNETDEILKVTEEPKKIDENIIKVEEETKEPITCKQEYTRENLMKLNLDGLRTMASDKNISLTKENGKQKTKKELIDNILE